MTNADKDLGSQQQRIDAIQSLLAEVLPELATYLYQKEVKTDRSGIHQGKAREPRELIRRVAHHVGKHPSDS